MRYWIVGLFFIWSLVDADDCFSCIQNKKEWCVESNSCNKLICGTTIKQSINCPLPMKPGYEYNDTYTRQVVLPLINALYADDSKACLQKTLPSTTYYQGITVQCYHAGPNATCHAYTAYDTVRKQIIVSFEGTQGAIQFGEEIDAFFHKKVNFFNVGNIFEYFDQAFYYLWNGGLQLSVRNLMFLYPDYELLSVGHSMGAAISSVFASHAIMTNLFVPAKVKLVTFGQPRTGDENFAQWHDNTFLYSYRIVHHKDPAPHIPPMGGADGVYHHRYEVWYNNDMKPGQNYTICLEADGPYGSNQQLDTIGEDHVIYFDTLLGTC